MKLVNDFSTIVQVDAVVTPAFTWNDRLLGKTGAQSFWLFLENTKECQIVYQERIAFNKVKVGIISYLLDIILLLLLLLQVVKREPQHLVFTIPIRDHQLTDQFQLRLASDYFLSDDTVVPLSMHNCILPKSCKAHTGIFI